MSCADIICSIFGALTSLPMPAEPPPGVTYNFNATRIGNEHTCEMQGFGIFLGVFASYSYNSSLCTYYALKMALSFSDATLDRIEPFLFHAVPILTGLGVATAPLIFDLYNPSSLGAYCTCVPVGCDPITGECERGDINAALVIIYIAVICIFMAFFIMFVSFGLILRKVFHLEKLFAMLKSLPSAHQEERDEHEDTNAGERSAINSSRFTSKSILMQMFGYVLPLILALIFQLIDTYQNGLDGYQKPGVITNLRLAFFPLMGFFNLLVFVYHKVYNYRRIMPDDSRTKVVKLMLQGRLMEPTLITSISIVAFDQANMVVGDNQNDVSADRKEVMNAIRENIFKYIATKANEDTFAQDNKGGEDQVSKYSVSGRKSGHFGGEDGNASRLSLSLGGFTIFGAGDVSQDQSLETWSDDGKKSKESKSVAKTDVEM